MFIYLTFLFDILIFLLHFYNTSLDRSITPEKRQNKKYCMYQRERERERKGEGVFATTYCKLSVDLDIIIPNRNSEIFLN